MCHLQVTLCCASINARPQVWNIGFGPNGRMQQNPNGQTNTLPRVVQTSSSTTTAAPAVPVTTPSREYYACLSRCPSTSEYNPICGSDALSYHNIGRLECAALCGTNVSMRREGTCLPVG